MIFFYLLVILSNIGLVCQIIAYIGWMATGIGWLAYLVDKSLREERLSKIILKVISIVTIVATVFGICIPTLKELCFMFNIPF